MEPNLDDIYAILRRWATAGNPQSYGDLSRAYQARTGNWFEPHGTWDAPLGELDNRLANVEAPALSALVILQEANEPGAGSWGCAPNVPNRPVNDIDRIAVWTDIVTAVRNYPWPEALPA
jgi:hypothetical protein